MKKEFEKGICKGNDCINLIYTKYLFYFYSIAWDIVCYIYLNQYNYCLGYKPPVHTINIFANMMRICNKRGKNVYGNVYNFEESEIKNYKIEDSQNI